MTGAVYKGIKQNTYTFAGRIGSGGEGDVYSVKEDNAIVAKLYKELPDRDKTEKLAFMASMANDELLRFAAWPTDVIRDKAGRVCGFIMRKLEGYKPLHMLLTPMDRKRMFPDKGYNFLAHVARNLAVAFHKIHQMGIVVGDVNEANILVNNTGMIALIDCDSFQIQNGTRYHFCEVGMLRYTPPELLRRGFENTVRTTNTDAFSLATLIFQLLFLGRAPFTGINPGKQEIDEETAIKTNEFAYSLKRSNKRLFPAKSTLELNAFPAGLVAAFHEAFEATDNRPTPLRWANELSELIKEMAACGQSKLHFYPGKLGRCPWCVFQQRDNIHYFLDDRYLKTMPELNNIEQFVNGFRLEPVKVKTLPTTYSTMGMRAQKIDARFHRLRYLNWLFYTAIIVAIFSSYLYTTLGISVFIAGMGILRAFYRFSPTQIKIKDELKIRERAFDNLKLSLLKLVKLHNEPPELMRYNEAARNLTAAISTFRNLPVEYANARKVIEDRYYQIDLNQYLQQFQVLQHPISKFGPAKKQLIFQNGIRTAADVNKLKQTKIPGIGPKNEQILFDWQRQVGMNFTYRPDSQLIDREVALQAQAIVKKRRQLEDDIRQQYKMVMALRATVLSSVQTLELQYQGLLLKVQQAELDHKSFQRMTL